MSRIVAFAYAGARAQARYGQLLSDGQWERLQRLPDLGSFLQAARDTALRPWVLNLQADTGAHTLEAALRAQFRLRVRAAAQWAPRPWGAALRWIEALPDIPGAAHVLGGKPAYPWMAGEPAPALARAWGEGRTLAAAWLERFRSLWPAPDPALERLALLAQRALGNARHEDAAAAAARIQPALRRVFRAHTRAPAGLAAYLALCWLEGAALRGALLRRRFTLTQEVAA